VWLNVCGSIRSSRLLDDTERAAMIVTWIEAVCHQYRTLPCPLTRIKFATTQMIPARVDDARNRGHSDA
jgi:hypothetical protein